MDRYDGLFTRYDFIDTARTAVRQYSDKDGSDYEITARLWNNYVNDAGITKLTGNNAAVMLALRSIAEIATDRYDGNNGSYIEAIGHLAVAGELAAGKKPVRGGVSIRTVTEPRFWNPDSMYFYDNLSDVTNHDRAGDL